MAKKVFGIALFFLVVGIGSVFADGNTSIIRQLIRQCEQSLGVRITINQSDDYRTEQRQAELMANMSSGTRRSLYNNAYYLDEMDKYDNLPRSQKIDKFGGFAADFTAYNRAVSALPPVGGSGFRSPRSFRYAQTFGLNIPTAHYTHSLSALEMLRISFIRAAKPS
ncbi:MAG: hypothetical protein LBO80_03280 [Treponema sp.]|nr:hypothetical protein [Treponema sp.]